jgi:bifunctional non-homologous end joining protein LigD
VAFQRKKSDPIGVKAALPGFVDPGLAASDLRKRLEPLVRKTQAFAKRIAHKGIWVEPKLLAEIEYRAKSAEGKAQQPYFKGLREDM